MYTEEATKTSMILPFFQLLGYDVFNPLEFVPEYTADAGVKKVQHLFTLHKFDDTNYECEYYFDSVEQLGTIKDLILDTYNKCCKTQ